MLGVLICREAKGRLWVTADTAAALVCGFQRWVWVNPWFDGIAKLVLAHRVWHAVHELWTPVQHDTHATGLLPGWQERSHLLATWGRDNPQTQGFPIADALCLLRDVPAVLWQGRALVISYVSMFSELRDVAEWCDSELSVQLAGSGFLSNVSCAVCEDSEVPLTHHRVAAYLRLLPSMPRTFFDVPPCCFCALSEGNQWAHVQYCSVLYLCMGQALTALVEEVAQRVRVLSCDVTDLLARLQVPGGVLVVGVVPEQEVPSVSTWADSVLGASQVVLVSWTGLVHLSAQVPWPLSRSDGVALAKVVLARMACDVPRDEMFQQAPRSAPFVEGCRVWTDGVAFAGYSVGVRARAQVAVSVQRLVAWLLQLVPGATLPWITDLSVACRLGRWNRVARTHCRCYTVMSCGARRQRQDRGTRTPVSYARVSETTLRTRTSMHCTIQWLSMCPANSRFQSCNYFDNFCVL